MVQTYYKIRMEHRPLETVGISKDLNNKRESSDDANKNSNLALSTPQNELLAERAPAAQISGTDSNLDITKDAAQHPSASSAVKLAKELGTQPVSKHLHVFYYAWYGTPAVDKKWLHWNHQVHFQANPSLVEP